MVTVSSVPLPLSFFNEDASNISSLLALILSCFSGSLSTEDYPQELMAQFTAQGRVKLLGNGEVWSVGLGSIDPLPYKLRSVWLHGRKFTFSGPSAKLHSSSHSSSPSSSASSKDRSGNVTGSKPRNVSEESVHVDGDDDSDYSDEESGEDDDLACFRGLVLDLSYRSVLGFRVDTIIDEVLLNEASLPLT